MPESARNPHENFVIQRRNLVIMSIFVLFYKVGHLDVKTIKFFGNQVDIGNPDVVLFALHIIFFYFLWRYYTAFRTISGWSEFIGSGRIWSDTKFKSIAKEKALKIHKSLNSVPYVKQRAWTQLSVAVYTSDKGSGDHIEEKVVFSYGALHLRFWSYIHSIITRTSFSDYIFPYVLAFIAALELYDNRIIEKLIL